MAVTDQVALAVSSYVMVAAESSGSRGRTAFQWGGTIAAIFLLILNRWGRRSTLEYSLLILYLFTSFPTVLFEILRGQFGYWVAFLAVAAHLFFPETFPFSRFIIFVVTPDWVADGLRDTIAGGVFCLVVCVFLVLLEVRGMGGSTGWECNSHCSWYLISILLLILFTILYLCLGPW
ncbi:hypothetical protein NMG60_11026147 [Bertholletia excelsa]